MKKEIIIIGAGAAGLVAARELCKKKHKVKILEARENTGGRIYTLTDLRFSEPLELGAEFIHGKAPTTFKLLKEYAIPYKKLEGEIWQHRFGEFREDEELIKGGDVLKERLKKTEGDLPLETFLNNYFPGSEHKLLRHSVRSFVEGYDSADTNRASAMAFKGEWDEVNGGPWEQYRIEGGYGRLIEELTDDCIKRGCPIYTGVAVKEIRWTRGRAQVVGADNEIFSADKILITVPLGVLQETEEGPGICFEPPLPHKERAIRALGFGATLKVFIEFKDAFWKKKMVNGKSLENMDFIFSDAVIPTWWTQSGGTMLTGWLAGPPARERKTAPPKLILKEALLSLAAVFDEAEGKLKENIKAWKVFNWSADVFARGSYVYGTVGAEKNIKTLGEPVEDTLYFAGELFGADAGTGTVEAALNSGLKVAEEM